MIPDEEERSAVIEFHKEIEAFKRCFGPRAVMALAVAILLELGREHL